MCTIFVATYHVSKRIMLNYKIDPVKLHDILHYNNAYQHISLLVKLVTIISFLDPSKFTSSQQS